MANRLAGKSALITGAGRGIGEAIALRFAEEGAHVFVSDLDSASAQSVAEAIKAHGGKAQAFSQDVTDEESWAPIIDEIVRVHGAFDVLVNNAGVAMLGTIESMSLQDWRTTQAVNLEAVFMGTQAAVAAMKTAGGSIINISSVAGIVGDINLVAYNASKGGVRLMTKSAALHCANEGYNVRVNSVHPGVIRTKLLEQAFAEGGKEMEDRSKASIPVKELGDPLDVANGCLFLASDESKYMTGSELVIDGGYTCQ